jgi:hypothetical protein
VSQMSTGLSDDEKRSLKSSNPIQPRGPPLDDDCVMSVQQWAQRAGISYPTAKRLIAAGEGPAITQLSPNRVGITFGAHRAWLKARTEQSAA